MEIGKKIRELRIARNLTQEALAAVLAYGDQVELRLKNYRQLFFRTETLSSRGSGPQMREEFEAAERLLRREGGSVAENLQRTWIYCRDIDNNYAALVAARRELFRQYGLTESTHYIASTGIEGMPDPFDRLVRMDSFALFGHRPEQIEYLQALDHLSPTHVYGVTFERGTRIVYGDRSHYYISGTASIDREGKIVHPGDVFRQTGRLIGDLPIDKGRLAAWFFGISLPLMAVLSFLLLW